MGVPGLIRIILEKYRNIHAEFKDNVVDYFYIDFNPIIYNIYNKNKQYELNNNFEEHLIDQVCNELIKLIEKVNAKKLTYIAIDGSAPFAKMIQQRERRFKKVYDQMQIKKIYEKHGQKYKEPWDTSNITPGTIFMQKLDNAIKEIIKNKENVIFSGYTDAGEGEHKILQHINTIKFEQDDQVYVFSNDGDVIFLCCRYPNMNIYMLTNPNSVLKIVKDLYLNVEHITINIKELFNSIIEEFDLCDDNNQRTALAYDIIGFSMFAGNDFVKEFPFLKMRNKHTFGLLFQIYKQVYQELQENFIYKYKTEYRINVNFLLKYVRELANKEWYYLKKEKQYINNFSYTPVPETFNEELTNYLHKPYYVEDHPLYEKFMYEYNKIDYNKNPHIWKRQYYCYYFNKQCNNFREYNSLRSMVCFEYLQSIVFALNYYLNCCPSWTWHYSYLVAPLPSDLYTYINIINNNDEFYKIYEFVKGDPVTPIEQLMLVLPPQTELLPKKYKKLMNDLSLKMFYPKYISLELTIGKKNEYSVPFLPRINIDTIKNEINLLS